eukprot:CAMPEP_0115083800 /NCGR_PEP_ID=MMETSP0227-20121206/20818_1 /TAXON_ID=89957 /ORGANISM="Polarella glacialis, Strain CCMP 1383" /LENGTH=161 /DNA_ID=CAMNT_0002472361 /DNA_START=15 /DNA_END=498 /DNA_ORIENTATION=-
MTKDDDNNFKEKRMVRANEAVKTSEVGGQAAYETPTEKHCPPPTKTTTTTTTTTTSTTRTTTTLPITPDLAHEKRKEREEASTAGLKHPSLENISASLRRTALGTQNNNISNNNNDKQLASGHSALWNVNPPWGHLSELGHWGRWGPSELGHWGRWGVEAA